MVFGKYIYPTSLIVVSVEIIFQTVTVNLVKDNAALTKVVIERRTSWVSRLATRGQARSRIDICGARSNGETVWALGGVVLTRGGWQQSGLAQVVLVRARHCNQSTLSETERKWHNKDCGCAPPPRTGGLRQAGFLSVHTSVDFKYYLYLKIIKGHLFYMIFVLYLQIQSNTHKNYQQ